MSTRTRTSRVREVEPLDRFLLRLVFDDGTVREIDLEPEFRGPVFEPFKDPALFRQVREGARPLAGRAAVRPGLGGLGDAWCGTPASAEQHDCGRQRRE